MATKIMVTVDTLAIQVPDGWSASVGAGWLDFDGETVWPVGQHGVADDEQYVKFERTAGDLHVVVSLTVHQLEKGADKWERERAFQGAIVEGQTTYNGRCFTRRGIDSYSCKLATKAEYEHEYNSLPGLLLGEWTRCVQAHERSKTMVPVPGLPGGWKVTPQRKQQIAEQLKAGKPVAFTPHGMGVGYEVTRKQVRYATVLPKATSEFFGIAGTLYYTTLDCD